MKLFFILSLVFLSAVPIMGMDNHKENQEINDLKKKELIQYSATKVIDDLEPFKESVFDRFYEKLSNNMREQVWNSMMNNAIKAIILFKNFYNAPIAFLAPGNFENNADQFGLSYNKSIHNPDNLIIAVRKAVKELIKRDITIFCVIAEADKDGQEKVQKIGFEKKFTESQENLNFYIYILKKIETN